MSSLNSVIVNIVQMHRFFISLVFGLLLLILVCRHEVGPINVQRLHTSATVPNSNRSTNVQQPYGPRMCGRLCRRINKCRTPLFNEEQLVCYLAKPVSQKYPLTRLFTPQSDGTVYRCDAWSILFFTRLHGRKCVTGEKTISRHHDLSKLRSVTGEKGLKSYSTNLTLHQACENGQVEAVMYVLSHHLEDINCKGAHGRTPIMVTSRQGHLEVFDYLVRQDCDLSLRDQNNDTLLHMACYGGNTDIVRKIIIEQKHNVDEVGGSGMTPVMVAALYGHKEVVEFLVNMSCNVTVAANNGNNLLHIACSNGRKDIVEYIVKRKLVNINSRGIYGRTAVMMAAEHGHKEIVKLLIREGCNLTLVDKYSHSIFHRLCISDKVDIAKYLIIQNIVHKESKDGLGRTPLMISAWFGATRVFDLLVSEGYSLSAADARKNNVLHVACLGGHIDMVKHIIKCYNVDIESKGFVGRTPLLTTAGTARKANLDFLVRKGCNVRVVDDDKNNILHVASLSGHLIMVKHIIKQYNVDIESKGYAGRTPFLIAAGTAHIAIVDFLVREGCNVKALDNWKNNVLHIAVQGGNLDMVQFIIDHIKVDMNSRGYKRRTPLLIAAGLGSETIFHLLEKNGSNMKAVDDDKSNILLQTCSSGNIRLVRYVISKNLFDIDCRGALGETPVLQAAYFGRIVVVKFLKEEGCNMKAVDGNGNNIMHAACFSENVDLLRYIIRLRVVSVSDKNYLGQTPLNVAKAMKYSEIVDVLTGD